MTNSTRSYPPGVIPDAIDPEKTYLVSFDEPTIQYAREIATALHGMHFPEVEGWKPADNMLGLLTQIDNMTAHLSRKTTR